MLADIKHDDTPAERQQLQLLVDARWRGEHGIGRFSREVLRRLSTCDLITEPTNPAAPWDCLRLSWRLARAKQCCFFSPGFNAPLWFRGRLVFVIHDLIHLKCEEVSSRAKRAYFSRVVRPAARKAFRVLTVSEFSKREITAWAGIPPEKIVVVGNGVADAFTATGPQHSAGYDYVLCVANQKPHKNIPRLLEAFVELRSDKNDLRLVISGAASPETAAQIARLGLTQHVIFAGTLSDADLAAMYRGALATIVPSTYEGFGLAALESMACGAPVVCSDCASLPEVVGDAALLVDPYDVESIACGLRKVVFDDLLRQELAAKGLARANAFSWDTTARRVLRVLRAACEAPEPTLSDQRESLVHNNSKKKRTVSNRSS